MARALIIASALLMSACLHAAEPSSSRALTIWRELDRAEASRARGVAVGAAQPGSAAVELVDAERAVALALDADLQVAIKDAEADLAAAKVDAVRQLENPDLRITNVRPGGIANDNPRLQVALRVPIPRPWSRRAGIQAARFGAAASATSVEEARRMLRAEVLRLFARLTHLRADQALLEQLIRLQARRRALIAARVEKATATRLDLQLEDVAAHRLTAEVTRVIDRGMAIEGELRRLCAAGPELRFASDLAALARIEAPGDRLARIETALSRRPEVRAAAQRSAGAEAEASAARGEVVPWFSWAQVGYSMPSSVASWGLGVSLEVPLLSWGRGKIRSADVQVRLRRLQERAAVQAVVREVDAALERVASTAEYARRIETGLVAGLVAAVEMAARADDAGVLDPVKRLDLEVERVQAERRLLDARLEHREAVLDLEAAVGSPRHDAAP